MSLRNFLRAVDLLSDRYAGTITWVAFVSGLLGVTLFIVGASLNYNRIVDRDSRLAQQSEFRAHPAP